MKKHYLAKRSAAQSKRRRLFKRSLLAFLILLIAIGGYLGILMISPQMLPLIHKNWNSTPNHSQAIHENRLYVPKLKLNLAYNSGGATVLNTGAWYRYPERGNPEKGGNFILAGHRFKIGNSPAATKDSSPFYRLNILAPGDKIYVDYNGKRYEYEVVRNYTVAPTQIEIESPSDTPKMTLYTCTLKGASDGREVIDAKLINKDISLEQQF